MAELSGARTVVFVDRSDSREVVVVCMRVREEKVVRERRVPRMSLRGTDGWMVMSPSLSVEGGMIGSCPKGKG